MERTEFFVCKCGDVSHQLVLGTFDTEKNETRSVFAEFHLDNWGFMRRIKNAARYVLGMERDGGDYDDLLFRQEDMGRLKVFADYLNPNPKDIHQKSFTKDNVKNGSKYRWRYTTICSWQFYSKEHVYTFSVERHDCLDNDELSDTESSITASMKPGNLFYRLYRAVKFVFGYRSCYGDFDSFEFTENDGDKLHDFIKSSAL